jgi:hypothetical protein
MKGKVQENFKDFLNSAEMHQSGDAADYYTYGANPDDSDLPYNFERRPEVGPKMDDPVMRLEQIQALVDATLNVMEKVDEVNPYIAREINKAYKHIREIYLRSMDLGRRMRGEM